MLGSAVAVSVTGCCELRPFPKPKIPSDGVALTEGSASAFLAPRGATFKGAPTRECIDVHAHFFNASDVTIKGYLEGPVANSLGGLLGELVKLLAPIADGLGEIAPTASDEYRSLIALTTRAMTDADRRAAVEESRQKERALISAEFNRLIQSPGGRAFRVAYESLMVDGAGVATTERRPRIRRIDDDSVFQAMEASEATLEPRAIAEFAATDQADYAEGILAFVGYMLSSRNSNLITYQKAFTEGDSTIGVRRTLGALVDFDRWLKCAPRSAQEDQMRLHLKISQLSGHYMLPLISYNPWTDVEDQERSLALVEEAIRAGFVGVKIYPPNGFRPWGNASSSRRDGPTGPQLDAALKKLWLRCRELNVPVMAHAGPSMGRDDSHNHLGGPDEWQKLLNAPFWSNDEGPRVSLGHFGGDGVDTNWTSEFANLMNKPRGQQMFGDLGYWADLRCEIAGTERCEAAKARLRKALETPLSGGETVANRVMYGSDWLMLSKEKNWPAYAQQLVAALSEVSPDNIDNIFRENAKACFGSKLQLA